MYTRENKRTNKNKSLRVKIMIPQFLLLFIEFSLLFICIIGLGLLKNIRNNEYHKVETTLSNRTNELQRFFNLLSINSLLVVDKINDKFSSVDDKFLYDIFPDILNSTEYLNVSGAFVILDKNSTDENLKTAIYIRDTNVEVVKNDYTDIVYRIGPHSIAYDNKIKIDSLWSYNMDFTQLVESENNDFYTKHFYAAKYRKTEPINLYGYWSDSFKLSNLDREIITFTVPLFNNQGEIYGVYGIELSEDLILNKLPTAEIPYVNSVYMLYKTNEKNNISVNKILHTGAYFDVINSDKYKSFHLQATKEHEKLHSIKTNIGNELDLYCMVEELELYSPNSYFKSDNWNLACLVPKSELFSVSNRIVKVIILAFAIAILLGIIGIVFSGEMFVRPIKILVRKVKNINPKSPQKLKKIGVLEIDELSNAIEKLNYDVALSASKLSQTIDLVGLPLAGFEIDYSLHQVFLTDSMFNLLSIDKKKSDNNMVALEFWNTVISALTKNKEEGFENTYCFNYSNNIRWFRIKTIDIPNQCCLGIIIDVTDEISRHKQLEYETMHDNVTGFLKMNYFIKQIRELYNNNHFGLLFLIDYKAKQDVNYLEKCNLSTSYIKNTSELLSQMEVDNKVLGRMSGNYLGIYLYDLNKHEKNIDYFKSFIEKTQEKINVLLPYEVILIVGCSMYSSDTNSVDLMIKNAEFALNEARESQTENFILFNRKNYLESIAIIEREKALYDILSKPLLKYMYEPIVAIREHKIIGYNAILRTQSSILKTFEEVVDVARLNNKLYSLEKLGLESIFKNISEFSNEFGDSKVFFDSITNEIISKEKISEIDLGYSGLYKKIVFEIIDSEHCDDYILKAKNEELHTRGIEIALGKYGTAYSNEAILLYVDPSYIKLSSLLVRGVHKDESRQKLILNIISYAKSKNIKIIASDVINAAEFEALVKMGIEFYYGNYFCSAKYSIDEIINQLDDIYIKIDEMAYQYGLNSKNIVDRVSDLIKHLPTEIQLTKREEEIVYFLFSSKSNAEIAENLDISSNTLKTHLRNIFNKFNVSCRKDLLNLCGDTNSELSTREKEILQLIVDGNSNEEIAMMLNISINTVRVHIWNICSKQNVKNRDNLK